LELSFLSSLSLLQEIIAEVAKPNMSSKQILNKYVFVIIIKILTG